LEHIHPIFPVLASSKALVQSLLWRAPLGLQNAFYNGFFSVMKHFSPDSGGQMDGDTVTTWRLLHEWEAERKPRSSVTDLVRLQTLIMAMISVDCVSIASAKGLLVPTKFDILARAVGLGYSMGVHSRAIDPNPNPEQDPNSDDNVALRSWWVLVMLDRWHALGMAKPTMIVSDLIVPPPGLKHIVGETVFALLRESFSIRCLLRLLTNLTGTSYVSNFIVPFLLKSPTDASESRSLAILLSGITQMLSWVIPSENNHPVLNLAYWHLRAVAELLCPDREQQRPPNLLQATEKLTGLLATKHDLFSPVTHHFVAVAALGLIELHRFANTRDEAARLTGEVLEYSMAPSAWNAAVRHKLTWYQARLQSAADPSATAAAAAGQNLQQLADLASAVDGSATAAGPDAAAATASGDARQHAEAALGAAGHGTAPTNGDGVTTVATSDVKTEAGSVETRDDPLPALVDVRAVLRNGYLTWYDDPNDGALA
jgi:hypothetical protein